MPSGLTPLSSVIGFTDNAPQATREQLSGGTVDPRHVGVAHDNGTPIYAVLPAPVHGPYGLEADLMGMDVVLESTAGHGVLIQDPTADLQPITHAAPWPGGVPGSPWPEDMADRHEQVVLIRGTDERMGGVQEMNYIPTYQPKNAEYNELYSVESGSSLQVPVPQQVQTGAGGFASRDRVQSMAPQNQYGYDSAHLRARYPTNGLVGNYQWMEPGTRPLRKGIPGPAIVPVGEDSPFAGQIPGEAYNTDGAILNDRQKVYAPPATVGLASSYGAANGDDAEVSYW